MRFFWLAVTGFGLVGACGGSAFTGHDDDAHAGSAGDSSAGEANGGAGGSTPNGGRGGVANGGAETGGASVAGAALGGGAGAQAAGSGGAMAEGCPATSPVAGKACEEGSLCSYGDDLRPACRTRFACPKGKWVGTSPAANCAPLSDCSMTPSGFPIIGKACQTIGEECTFDGGESGAIYCRCSFCGTEATCPEGMADWACAGPPIGCPEEMPNEGAACTKKQSCFYGVPCEGVTMECDGDVWALTGGGCAN